MSERIDVKSEDGLWLKTYKTTLNGETKYIKTRAGVLWTSINLRCNPKSSAVRNNHRYTNCENRFKDFQEFAEWCQTQHGYMHKGDNGRYWQLDKDILSCGTALYSPNTCVFVPQRINLMFALNNKNRGDLPLGVTTCSKNQDVFIALGSDGKGNTKYLGRYQIPFNAHKAWQLHKANHITSVVGQSEIKDHTKLAKALLVIRDRILDDLANNNETVFN